MLFLALFATIQKIQEKNISHHLSEPHLSDLSDLSEPLCIIVLFRHFCPVHVQKNGRIMVAHSHSIRHSQRGQKGHQKGQRGQKGEEGEDVVDELFKQLTISKKEKYDIPNIVKTTLSERLHMGAPVRPHSTSHNSTSHNSTSQQRLKQDRIAFLEHLQKNRGKEEMLQTEIRNLNAVHPHVKYDRILWWQNMVKDHNILVQSSSQYNTLSASNPNFLDDDTVVFILLDSIYSSEIDRLIAQTLTKCPNEYLWKVYCVTTLHYGLVTPISDRLRYQLRHVMPSNERQDFLIKSIQS